MPVPPRGAGQLMDGELGVWALWGLGIGVKRAYITTHRATVPRTVLYVHVPCTEYRTVQYGTCPCRWVLLGQPSTAAGAYVIHLGSAREEFLVFPLPPSPTCPTAPPSPPPQMPPPVPPQSPSAVCTPPSPPGILQESKKRDKSKKTSSPPPNLLHFVIEKICQPLSHTEALHACFSRRPRERILPWTQIPFLLEHQ